MARVVLASVLIKHRALRPGTVSAPMDRGQKRLALSRDQRQVLEAVYSVEKLPDAALRERLSKYLDLSTRQIQVWFQNRRQRAKASGGSSPAKKSVLNTPSQIMDALFEFSGTLSAEAGQNLLAAASAHQAGATANATAVRSGSSNGSGTTDSPPATSLDYETFEWGLPQQPIQPLTTQPPAVGLMGTHAPVPMRAAVLSPPLTDSLDASGTAPTPPVWAATDILDAVLGFACHEMCLEAVELWPLPTASGPASEPIFAHYASPGACHQARPNGEHVATWPSRPRASSMWSVPQPSLARHPHPDPQPSPLPVKIIKTCASP